MKTGAEAWPLAWVRGPAVGVDEDRRRGSAVGVDEDRLRGAEGTTMG